MLNWVIYNQMKMQIELFQFYLMIFVSLAKNFENFNAFTV